MRELHEERPSYEIFMKRLSALRETLAASGLAGFIQPRADSHLGEYVPPHEERLRWLTGFSGSAGLAVVLAERAALFVDGRYTLQAAAETEAALWERHHLIEDPPPLWIARQAGRGARIGYDPWLISTEERERFRAAGLEMVPLSPNPIDRLWTDRPPPPAAPAEIHPLRFAGQSSAEKRAALAAQLREAGEAAAVISDTASVNWLFNLRGRDLTYTPVVLAYALLAADGSARLFLETEKLSPEVRSWLEGVDISPPHTLAAALAAYAGKKVRVDPKGSPVWFTETLEKAGAEVSRKPDPCLLAKAVKNAIEQEGARAAHRRDGRALCRFLHHMARNGAEETEASAAARLRALRAEEDHFVEESFPAISAAGPHGAIVHYRVSAATDRRIGENTLYLIDSGGQYRDGTTDVTRTLWLGPSRPPAELARHYTLVLKGHIALARQVFPEGVAGPHLEAIARLPLWQDRLDYDHGTGHGVGSFLSVHEGPAAFSRHAAAVPLAPGMILSDEPGLYIEGAYGIRIENLLLVEPAGEGRGRRFLGFSPLTLAPYERALILPNLLEPAERAWLDAYHARVFAEIGPLLTPQERAWLGEMCAPLAG
jgi:Xaa-Pro aminopeptidase